MKKTITLMLLMSAGLFAQNILSIPYTSGEADSVITAEIVVQNVDPFVAFQADIQLNDQINYVPSSIALSGRAADHDITAQLLDGNILRILSYSLSQSIFSGDSGSVCTYDLSLGIVPGDYPLVISDPIIGDSSGTNILTSSVNGQVTILSSDIHVTPTDTVDYGEVPLTTTEDRTITINNIGNEPLEIFDINSSNPKFEVLGDTAMIVAPAGSHVTTIRFHADIKGLYIEDVTVESDDSDEASVSTNLKAIAFAVNELRLENMSGRSGYTDTLDISINNMEEFVGFSFDINIPSVLTLVNDSDSLLARASDHELSVASIEGDDVRAICFSPTNAPFSGSDGDVISMVFNIDGLGGTYPITFENVIIGDSIGQNILSDHYSGQLQIAAPDIAIDPTNLDFSMVSVFDTATLDLTINNVGNDTLIINDLQFYDTTYFSDQSLPVIIPQSENINFPVYYASETEGVENSTLRIRSNDPNEDPSDISLSAESFIPNTMYVDSMSTFADVNNWVNINVDNTEEFVGFQFDLILPDNFTFLDSVKLSSRAVDHSIAFSQLDPTTIRVLSYSLSQTPYTGTSGPIALIKFVTDTIPGDYFTDLDSVTIGNDQSENIVSSYSGGTITVIHDKTQMIPLNDSWNLISWNVNTLNDSIPVVLSEIHDDLIIVLGFESGGLTYDPLLPQFNTLNLMDHLHGYWVKVVTGATINVGGDDVDIQTPIYMEAGWNLISYLPGETDSLTHALETIYENIITVLGFDNGAVTHVPSLPGFNTLNLLEPTLGYWVKLTSSDTLIYPTDQVYSASVIVTNDFPIHMRLKTFDSNVKTTSQWINIYGQGINYNNSELAIGTHIKAVDKDGVVCGEAVVDNPGQFGFMAIYRDDPITDEDEGPQAGEIFYVYFGENTNPVEVTWTNFGDYVDISGQILSTNDSKLPDSFSLSQNYPNPFNPVTTIRYQIPEECHVHIIIYDISGRPLVTLVNNVESPGNRTVVWNTKDKGGIPIPSGIYFYRINAGSFKETKKMLLLK